MRHLVVNSIMNFLHPIPSQNMLICKKIDAGNSDIGQDSRDTPFIQFEFLQTLDLACLKLLLLNLFFFY